MQVKLSGLLVVLMASVTSLSADAQVVPGGCGSLQNAFGPFDYRPEKYVYETTYGSHAARVSIVERAHYTIETEMLVPRKTGLVVPTGADLSYTLRAFPNHHRALLTLIALGEKEKTDHPLQSIYTIDCWFKRAVAWAPDDNVVRLIYATYLFKSNRAPEAEEHLSQADRNSADKPFTQHNIGMIYFDQKNYDKALEHAQRAYALGFGIPTLKERLIAAGKWSDQPAGK